MVHVVAGEDPNGNAVDADDNNDDFTSMQEAFNYATLSKIHLNIAEVCPFPSQYSQSNLHMIAE